MQYFALDDPRVPAPVAALFSAAARLIEIDPAEIVVVKRNKNERASDREFSAGSADPAARQLYTSNEFFFATAAADVLTFACPGVFVYPEVPAADILAATDLEDLGEMGAKLFSLQIFLATGHHMHSSS